MVIKGISERFHDAAVAVMEDDKLLFASQSERFSRIKNDPHLCQELRDIPFDKAYFYEDWELKNQRRQIQKFDVVLADHIWLSTICSANRSDCRSSSR